MKGIESPLHHLKPGTEEYKKAETELIRQICEIDLGDESRFDDESPRHDLEQPETTDKICMGIRVGYRKHQTKLGYREFLSRGKIKR